MASQDSSPSSPAQPPPSSPPPETTTLAPSLPIEANGVDAPSDVESFHSGDEDFEAPQEEGKVANVAAGGDGDVGKAQDGVLGGSDGNDASLGGETLFAEGGGVTEAVESENVGSGDIGSTKGDNSGAGETGGSVPGVAGVVGSVEAEDAVMDKEIVGSGELGSSEAESSVPSEESVVNSSASGEVKGWAAEVEAPLAQFVGGVDAVKEDANDDSAEKVEAVSNLTPVTVTEASEEHTPVAGGGTIVKAMEDTKKVVPLVEPECVVPLENVAAEGGESVEDVEESVVADDSKASVIDIAMRDSVPDDQVVADANGATEVGELAKEDSKEVVPLVEPEHMVPLEKIDAEGSESVRDVEELVAVADDSKAPVIDSAMWDSVPDDQVVADANGATEVGDVAKEDSKNVVPLVEPEHVVPLENIDAEGGESVKDVEELVIVADDSKAPVIDSAMWDSVADANGATEVGDLAKEDNEKVVPLVELDRVVPSENVVAEGGESVEDVEELVTVTDDSKAPVIDSTMRDSVPDDQVVADANGATEVRDLAKEDETGAVSMRNSAAVVDTPNGSVGEEGVGKASSPDYIPAETGAEQELEAIEVENGVVDVASDGIQEESPVVGVEGGEDDGGEAQSLEEPAKVVILDSSETVQQLLKSLEEAGSRAGSSGVRSSRDFSQEIDGQIATDSDEEADTDEEAGGKELFDSAALAALLRAATGGSTDPNVTGTDDARSWIYTGGNRPAGLGSSMPALRPGPARAARLTPPASSELAVTAEPESSMDEEEKVLHEKVDQIRVKFLRLVHRLGHSAEDTVAAQVLYRLGLAEGIKRGRQTSRAFSIESAKRKAIGLEESGEEPLEFSCNILILGKTGVGKSSIINSILGKQAAQTSAFQPSTARVKEITGVVDGIKIRFLDTPGLRPSIMDQNYNKKVLSSIKKYTKSCPPDIVLYVDRLDTQTRDFNDLPLLRSIAGTLGSSIWFNAIVALTHAASAPPDGPNGTPLGYEVFVAQRSHVVQHSIRQAAGDMRLMNPVALVENHPSCRRNREGKRVLPNGTAWKPLLLLLCYSSKTLSEANSLLKLQDPSPGKLFGFRMRSPPLPYLLSSLLQSRAYPKLSTDQGGDNGDSDVDLGDLSDSDQEEEDEYDQLPPFKPLRKAQMDMLTKEQRKAYLDEYDYRVKLLQKKQWKEELRRLKEMKKRGKAGRDDPATYGDMADDYDQDGAPAAVPVPLPDMVLPPSFDCENPAYRYRFLEPTSQLLARPVLDTHGWDHDCGYDGVSLEENLAVVGQFPASVAVQITKDKKEFNVHLDSSIAAKLGENGSSLAGFDIQSVGKQLAYILRGEAKVKNLKKNRTTAGVSVTFLGENVVTGVKLEDQVVVGRRLCLVGSTGAVRSQGDMAYGANLEARLREKDYPVGQDVTTLGLSLMKWRRDLALGANFQTQITTGRSSKVAIRVGLNNKLTGQFTVRTSTSDQLQIALLGVIPVALSIYRTLWPNEAY